MDKDPISNCGAFSRLDPAARIAHLARRGASPRLGNYFRGTVCSGRRQSPPWSAVGRRYIAIQRTKTAYACQPEAIYLWHRVALPWHWGAQNAPVKILGFKCQPSTREARESAERDKPPCSHLQHCEDGLNRVVWDTKSREERLGCRHFSPHHQQGGDSWNRQGGPQWRWDPPTPSHTLCAW